MTAEEVPPGYTLGPDASQGEAVEPLPFALMLLMCFLLVDTGERVYELVRWALTDTGTVFTSANPYGPILPNLIIWVLVNPLLIFLLWLRTGWGRVLTQFVFLFHFLFVAYSLAVSHPELWIYLGNVGRVRLLGTLGLDLAVVAYLFSGQARAALDR